MYIELLMLQSVVVPPAPNELFVCVVIGALMSAIMAYIIGELFN